MMAKKRRNSKGDAKKQTSEGDHVDGKISPLLEEQTVVTYVTVPPDGGWGWVVVAASFCCNFFCDGIINTSGLYIGRVDEELEGSKASVALMGSILAGVNLLIGPFVSALVNRYGFRTVAVAGAVVASIGFGSSSFASRIEVLWFTYGFIGAVGMGLIYVPSVVAVGFYFERWRSTATCVAMVGSGVGTILLAPLTSYFLDHFGWRNTMLAQAGMVLSCAIYGMMFRPLIPVQISIPCEEDYDSDDEATADDNKSTITSNNVPALAKLKQTLEEHESKASIFSEYSMTSPTPSEINHVLKAAHNSKYATVHDVLQDSRCNIKTVFNKSSSSVHKPNEAVVKKKTRFDVTSFKDFYPKDNTEPARKLSGNILIEPGNCNSSSTNSVTDKPTNVKRRMSIQMLPPASYVFDRHRNSISIRRPSHFRRPSESLTKAQQNRRASAISACARPIYRDDIFLQVNPNRLPQHSSRGSGLDFTMQVTRLPTYNDVLQEESSECKLFPEAVRRTLATMLDVHLLASPSFLLLCVSGFFTNFGFYVPYMFLESRVKDSGMDPDLGKWLISTIGVSNTLGRIVCGVVTSSPRVSALLVNNVLLTIGGVATMFSGLYMTTNYQIFYAATFGFAVSAFSALRSILTVDVIGLENLTNGFGLMILFQGASASIGSPMAGFLMDLTKSYDITFILTGGVILFSAMICYPLSMLNKWERDRKARKSALSALTPGVNA